MKNKIILIIVGILLLGIAAYFGFIKDYDSSKEFTIKFDTKGGNKVADIKLKEESIDSLPIPVKEGSTFVGWYEGDAKIEKGHIFKKDTTLTAKWEELESEKEEPWQEVPEVKPASNTQSKPQVKTEPKKQEEPKKEEVKKEEPKQEEPKKEEAKPVTYVCEEGWELSGENCIKTASITYTCAVGTYEVGEDCVQINVASRKESNRECNVRTVVVDGNGHTDQIKGTALYNSADSKYYCYYGKVTDSQEQKDSTLCKNRGHSWLDGVCYYLKDEDYTKTCDNSYVYVSKPTSYVRNARINSGCFPKKAKVATCESGYTKTMIGGSARNPIYICKATKQATIK